MLRGEENGQGRVTLTGVKCSERIGGGAVRPAIFVDWASSRRTGKLSNALRMNGLLADQ